MSVENYHNIVSILIIISTTISDQVSGPVRYVSCSMTHEANIVT